MSADLAGALGYYGNICNDVMKNKDADVEKMADIQQPPRSSASGRVSILPPIPTPGREMTATGARGTSTIPRSTRGFSKKLQVMLKRQHTLLTEEGKEGQRTKGAKVEVKNWRQLTDKQLSKITAIERSRYLAYEQPPKEIQEKKLASLRRVRTAKMAEKEQELGPSLGDLIEYEKNNELVGQLKAAEARQRIRVMRIAYERNRVEELNHLIASQPSSIEAVRLKSFVPPHLQPVEVPELLNRKERIRCETILEDEKGLTINRT